MLICECTGRVERVTKAALIVVAETNTGNDLMRVAVSERIDAAHSVVEAMIDIKRSDIDQVAEVKPYLRQDVMLSRWR